MASKKSAVKKQSKNATVLNIGALLVPNQTKVKGKKADATKDAAFEFPTRKLVKAKQKLLKQEQAKTEPKFGMTVAQARKALKLKQPIFHKGLGNGFIGRISQDKSPKSVGFTHANFPMAYTDVRLTDIRVVEPVDTEVVMTDAGLVEVAAASPIVPMSPMKKRITFADLPLLTGFKTSLAHSIGDESLAFVKVGNSTAIRTIVRVANLPLVPGTIITVELNNMDSTFVRSSEKERFKKTQLVYPIVAAKEDATLVP